MLRKLPLSLQLGSRLHQAKAGRSLCKVYSAVKQAEVSWFGCLGCRDIGDDREHFGEKLGERGVRLEWGEVVWVFQLLCEFGVFLGILLHQAIYVLKASSVAEFLYAVADRSEDGAQPFDQRGELEFKCQRLRVPVDHQVAE